MNQKVGADDNFLSSVQIVASGVNYFLVCIVFLSVVLLVWGIFGKIPVNVDGIGRISSMVNEMTIISNYPGIVAEIYKGKGDTIHVGDRLMGLSELDLLQAIDESQLELSQKIQEDSIKINSLLNEKRLQTQTFLLNKTSILHTIKHTREKITYYEKLWQDKKSLQQKGIITETELKETEFSLNELRTSLVEQESEWKNADYNEKTYLNSLRIQINELKSATSMLQKKLANLKVKHERYSYVTSIYEAVILEVLVNKNETIEGGRKVYTVKLLGSDSDLYIDIFVPYDQKAKTDIGMDAVVDPFNVDKNRYGQIRSKVIEYNDFPSTDEFMLNLLVDQDVVKMFTSRGPVYYCKAVLEKDSATVSGLKWTSRKGTPFKIKPGMICHVEVHVNYVSPISLIIPWFRQKMQDE